MDDNQQTGACTRILIIDDHPVFRQGIRHVLEDEQGLEVVGEAGAVRDAVAWLAAEDADVALLDNNLSGESGVDAIPTLLTACSQLQIVMLTVSTDPEVLVTAIRNGACGFVLKDSPVPTMTDAIRAAHRGECRVSDSLVRALFRTVQYQHLASADAPQSSGAASGRQSNPALAVLSVRDIEILEQLVQGHSNKEIARALGLSPHTIRNQLQRLQDLFDAKNRVQLALCAFENGIRGG